MHIFIEEYKINLVLPVLYSKFVSEAIMSRNVFFYSILIVVLLVSGLSGCGAKKTVDAARNSYGNADKLADAAHNSKNSLNWDGVYAGIVPAGDTAGVELRVTLNSNETFEAQYEFVGKHESKFVNVGMFSWNDAGNIIELDIEHFPRYYAVGENILIQLDMNGNLISGSLADEYVLRKVE
jgi:uncharacterized lipoprotein NlpE involved in copper resistance